MRRPLIALLVGIVLAPALEAGAPPCAQDVSLTAIKASHPLHRALLVEGLDRSATFREMAADIQVTPWLVFVQTGRCPEKATTACLLHFVGRFEGRPYLRVIVPPGNRHPDNLISSLAHELQHAREVIQAGGVIDADGVRQLFRRIGSVSVTSRGVVTFETERARQIDATVWRELNDNPPDRSRTRRSH